MLDIYRPASSPGPQHFTPIAVLKLWKMEEKSSLLAQLRSGRTRLLQALQEKTRDSLKEHKIPHVIYFFSLFSKNTQPLKSKVRTVPFLRVHSNPQPRKKLHGEEYLSCWETGPSAEVKCKSNNENTQSFFLFVCFFNISVPSKLFFLSFCNVCTERLKFSARCITFTVSYSNITWAKRVH